MLNLYQIFLFFISLGILITSGNVVVQSLNGNNQELHNKTVNEVELSFNSSFESLNKSREILPEVRLNPNDVFNAKNAEYKSDNIKFTELDNRTLANDINVNYIFMKKTVLGCKNTNMINNRQINNVVKFLIHLYRHEKNLINNNNSVKYKKNYHYDHLKETKQKFIQEKLLYCYVKYSILIKGSRFQFNLTKSENNIVFTNYKQNILINILNNY